MRTIGIKSGTFTILTKGHVKCLEYCKNKCDFLIVVLNDNNYLIRKKGFCAVPAEERKCVLESVRYVDQVIIYSGNDEHLMVSEIKNENPDVKIILFHSSETRNKNFIPGKNVVDIEFCPDFESSSTTSIMKTIKNGM